MPRRKNSVAMRCFFPEELLALCRHHDFEVLERFGDYGQSPFGPDSAKQILVCARSR